MAREKALTWDDQPSQSELDDNTTFEAVDAEFLRHHEGYRSPKMP